MPEALEVVLRTLFAVVVMFFLPRYSANGRFRSCLF